MTRFNQTELCRHSLLETETSREPDMTSPIVPKLPTAEEAAAISRAQSNYPHLPKTKDAKPIIMEKEENGKLRRLVSYGNDDDPAGPDTESRIILRIDNNRTSSQRIADYNLCLSRMIVAEPLPNEHHTIDQIKAMGLVGVYRWEDVPDEESVEPDVVIGQ